MRIVGSFIGSDGVQVAHLPRLLSEGFGISVGEAKRLMRRGEVRLDGEEIELWDVPVERLLGAELTIGRERVTVDTTQEGDAMRRLEVDP